MITRRQHPERDAQRAICRLLASIGARVYTIGTTRKRGDHPGTMQTPGLPDVIAFLPAIAHPLARSPYSRLLCVEVKAEGGRLSEPQAAFRAQCEAAQVAHVAGGLDAVIDWLTAEHYVRREGVAIRILGRGNDAR